MDNKIKKAVKENLLWIQTEIVAGKVLAPNTKREEGWNSAHDRTLRVIDNYIEGRGLFQVNTEYEE